MFDWVLNASLLRVKNKKTVYLTWKAYDFLWMEFNCFKVTEPLQGDSLPFTTQSPLDPGNHLINFNWMEGWNDLDLESNQ